MSAVADTQRASNFVVEPTAYSLRNFAVDANGHILGSRGKTLIRVSVDGTSANDIYRFRERVNAVHATAGGAIVVATDPSHWNPETPSEVFISEDNGATFEIVRRILGGSVLWWSIASDSRDTLYLGEYGPRDRQMSKTVVRSRDLGKTWSTIFELPDVAGSHIHRVATDPFTDDVWVSHGDGRQHRGVHRSRDGGDSFERIADSQATGIAFTDDSIMLGEDRKRDSGVTRLDRTRLKPVLDLRLSQFGSEGASIYSMAVGPGGIIYAPTMKYPDQSHAARLWVRVSDRWQSVLDAPLRVGGAAGFETIAGPDASGWMYLTGYRVRYTATDH